MDGQEIKDKRLSLHMTQQMFADELEVSRRSVVDWEANKSRPSIGTLRRIKELRTVAAPRAKQYPPTHMIDDKSHPECIGRDADGYFKRLAHPKWYNQRDCPLAHLAPAGDPGSATAGELALYTAPSPESVWQLFIDHNVPREDAIRFMAKRGHTQFGTLKPVRSLGDFMEATAGEGTLDDYLKLPTAKD